MQYSWLRAWHIEDKQSVIHKTTKQYSQEMAELKVLLYSKQKTQRILYSDQDGMMTTEIEQAFLRESDVLLFRNGGAGINVSEKTKKALTSLQTKYDEASRHHIRKLLGFLKGLSDGEFFYYFNEDKTTIVERKTAIACLRLVSTQSLFRKG